MLYFFLFCEAEIKRAMEVKTRNKTYMGPNTTVLVRIFNMARGPKIHMDFFRYCYAELICLDKPILILIQRSSITKQVEMQTKLMRYIKTAVIFIKHKS